MSESDINGHLLLLHQLWRSLCRGDKSSHRPALPTELVAMIFRIGDELHVPIHKLNISVHFSDTRTVSGTEALMFTRRLTTSLSHTLRKYLIRLDIGITSRTRSWPIVLPESESWFDIALYATTRAVTYGDSYAAWTSRDVWKPREVLIAPEEEEDKTMKKKKKKNLIKSLTWRVHENEIARGDLEFKRVTVTLGGEHEIWKWVEVGDRIYLIGCAQSPSANDVQVVSFRFFKYFEPVV